MRLTFAIPVAFLAGIAAFPAIKALVDMAHAQNIVNIPTTNRSVSITTGGTFQQILAATPNTRDTLYQSLTIQNNQTTTDNCWIHIGGGTVNQSTSILLAPGQAYTRYFPYTPSDAIQGTCTTNGDKLYVDTQ
jgi:hypothetical protein